ncbi:unnamed protein product, partial [Phaeothamnion confervicola]
QVDNSGLTGEAEPQPRAVEALHTQPLEAENLAFFGTTLLNGRGMGVVIRCGDATVMGNIAELAGTDNELQSPLAQEIRVFV